MSLVESAHESVRSRTLLVRSLQFVRPLKRQIAGISALAIIVAALGVAEPLLLKRIFDALGARASITALVVLASVLLGLLAARTALEALLNASTWRTRLGVDYRLREALLGKLGVLPLSYHQRESVGGTVNRVNRGIDGYVNAFSEIAFKLTPALAYLILATVALFRLEWRLAVIVLAFTPLPALIGVWAAREQTERERKLMQRWTTLYSRLNETLDGIRIVKSFAMEEVERRRFLSGQREGNAIVERGARTDATTSALRGFAAILARIAVLIAGSILVSRGQVTVGTLVAVLGFVGALLGPVQGLTDVYQTLQRGTVALETIYDILDAPDTVADVAKPIKLADARGEVRFEGVSYSYDNGTRVLHDIHLHVTPGETVAIVGPSGGGKTTMSLLLQRLYPLDAGRITVDGVNIRDISARTLRQNISAVYQDIGLFNDTVRDNIAYGRPTANDSDIEEAARMAFAHDFIMALPDGYDTVVGEHGSRLSGGQKQRIGIARALLKDAPILVLDEATAALDARSEAHVQQALANAARGRTTFIIAHRLATVVNADRIVVLRDGRIEAIGTHVDLMHQGGYYAKLVNGQMGGMLLSNAA
ncbi:MAG: putative type multidrug transport system, ATP-binding and permease component [Gemmatimonadetes bacterium]|nr:putative type multidrug transport system, ATP-binding and permease component [Gemmatimonadota bacterium]